MAVQDASVSPEPVGPVVVDPDELAANNAATGIGRGEQQAALFAEHVARVESAGAFVAPPDLGPPPPGPQPGPDPLRGAKVVAGRMLGAVGSGFFHGVTDILGRNTNDRVWTNWYSSGKHLPGPAPSGPRSSSSPTCASRCSRTTSCAPTRRCRRPRTPTRRRRCPSSPAAGARPTAAGTTCPRTRTAGSTRWSGRRTPASSATSATTGAGRGAPAADPATDPVSVRELSRELLAPKGERRSSARSSTCGRRRGSSSRTTTGSATAPTSTASRPRSRSPRTTRCARYGIDHLDVRRSHADPTRRADGPDESLPPDVPQRGDALVGRLAALRQRLGDPARAALHVGGKLTRDRRRHAARSTPRPAPSDRASSRNWWVGLGDAAHALRPRAQRDLRHARASPPRLGRRGALPDRPARQRRGHGQDPHRRVDARDPAQRRCSAACWRTGSAWSRRSSAASSKQVARGHPDHQPRARRDRRQRTRATFRRTGCRRSSSASTGCTRCCPTGCGWSTSTARRTRGAVRSAPGTRLARRSSPSTASRRSPAPWGAVAVRPGQQQLPRLAAGRSPCRAHRSSDIGASTSTATASVACRRTTSCAASSA